MAKKTLNQVLARLRILVYDSEVNISMSKDKEGKYFYADCVVEVEPDHTAAKQDCYKGDAYGKTIDQVCHRLLRQVEDIKRKGYKYYWEIDPEKVAYFKCNTLEKEFRGKGIGTLLLNKSIGECKRLGALAGLAHISVGSVNQYNYKYFIRAGGKDVTTYFNHWNRDFNNKDYVCSRCGDNCQCSVSEMILDFSTHKELSYV